MHWRQILLSCFLIVGFVIIVISSGALLLPESVHIQSRKTIAASDSLVITYLNDIENWPEILPWLSDTSHFRTQILNEKELIWKNPDGKTSGRLLLLSQKNNIHVQLLQPGKPIINYTLNIIPKSSNASRLEWVAHAGEMKGLKRWNYFLIRDWVKKDIDKSMRKVPDMIANSKFSQYNLRKIVTQFESARYVLYHKQFVNDTSLWTTITENWEKLLSEIQQNNWKKTDVPYFYFEKTPQTGIYFLETGHAFLADSADIFPNDRVMLLKSDSISFANFRGDFIYLDSAFSELQKALKHPLMGKRLIACLDTNITRKKISLQTRWVISQYHQE